MSSIEYIIVPRNNGTVWQSTLDYPSLWFATAHARFPDLELDRQLGISIAPYLTPALPIYPGMYVEMSLTLATRRFIVSSGIKDAITGSNPYAHASWNDTSKAQMDRPVHAASSSLCYTYGNGSQTVAACGSVRFPPTGLIRHPTVTQRQLSEEPRSPYCTVIEDYRKSSMFDVLGSIGGLLALLQGVHVFLFGRPLFWGMFVTKWTARIGAKLLTPFGLVGQFANRSFRQRLQSHYYSSGAESSATAHESENASPSTFLISQFLLDYVLDLGPAAAAPTATERDNAKPSYVDAGPESILQTSEHNRLLVSESVHRPLSAEGHSDPEPSSTTGDQRA
ncbi:hypothetical protein FRC12_009488 [Ceratobasidium sp. 428]|nr:hypothetical protein FRC12_009488 [Ceratobasidium sp. 428]